MTPLDIGILAIVGLSVLFGILRGLVRELIGLAGLVAAFLLAALLGHAAGAPLAGFLPDIGARLFGSTAVFFLTLVAAALLGRLFSAIVDAAQLTISNRLLGGLFGLVRGTAFVLVIFVGLRLFLPASAAWIEGSRLGRIAWSAAGPVTRLVPFGPRPAAGPEDAPPGGGQSL